MEKPIISILKNNTKLSADTFILVREKLLKRGFDVREEFPPQSKLIVSIEETVQLWTQCINATFRLYPL